MKTLYLVRHSNAAPLKEKTDDFTRKLTKKGKQNAKKMAQQFAKDGPAVDLIISSPATRALETAQIYAKALGYDDSEILLYEHIYEQEGGAESLLKLVHSIDNSRGSAMIVGHEPLLSTFATFLRRTFTEDLPENSVVHFDFNNRTWDKISKGRGMVKSFEFPNKEAVLRQQFIASLEAGIADSIREQLTAHDPESADRIEESVQKGAQKLVKAFLKKPAEKKKKKKPAKGKGKGKSKKG